MNDKQLEQILQEEPDEAKVWQAVKEYRKAYMQGRENKQRFCDLLCATLKEARQHEDLMVLVYRDLGPDHQEVTVCYDQGPDHQEVTIYYDGGSLSVNVTMDSGIAMIRDILEALK
jgi:hypothetical protein